MEPLHELVEVEIKGSEGSFHLYRTESNRVYCDGYNCKFSDADVKSWRVVYSCSDKCIRESGGLVLPFQRLVKNWTHLVRAAIRFPGDVA